MKTESMYNQMMGVDVIDRHPNQFIRVRKNSALIRNYRQDMEYGHPHPLAAELEDIYEMVGIGYLIIDNFNVTDTSTKDWLEEYHGTALKTFLHDPKVSWANDNSFDGIYVEKEPQADSFSTKLKISCYMKKAHATFWRLKF